MLILTDPVVWGGQPQQEGGLIYMCPLLSLVRTDPGIGTPFGCYFLKFGGVMWCRECGGTDHWTAQCQSKPRKEAKAKKPWVKPTLTKIHLIPAVSLTETKAEALERLAGGNVSLTSSVSLTGFDRKTYQRDYMRGVRGTPAGG